MVSLARNRRLEDLAARIRNNPSLREQINGNRLEDVAFRQGLDQFFKEFGDLFCNAGTCSHGQEVILKLLIEMAGQPAFARTTRATPTTFLTKRFLSAFPKGQQEYGKELLELGRASYRLRDDDNIHLGRIMAQTLRAYEAFQDRPKTGRGRAARGLDKLPSDVLTVIEEIRREGSTPKTAARPLKGVRLKARQLLGQPAGPGLVTGKARVILKPANLFEFKAGEILVCDAVDPTMTFVVPLAAGIVERRGGMLIHGSIIAREYGLPCVTGVPGATELIQTGDRVTVDGFLGIVILGEDSLIAGSH
jgi:phosphohistidine swiveling domain-containing protein